MEEKALKARGPDEALVESVRWLGPLQFTVMGVWVQAFPGLPCVCVLCCSFVVAVSSCISSSAIFCACGVDAG